MRVAALYDIHGNLPALEAVLADVRHVGADTVVVGGDVASGPMPRDTLELLLSLPEPVRFVRGNADRVLDFHGYDLIEEDDVWVRSRRWGAEDRGEEHLRFLERLPLDEVLEGVRFCHRAPGSDEEVSTRLTDDGRLLGLLQGLEERVVVCGHTHVQFAVSSTRRASSMRAAWDSPTRRDPARTGSSPAPSSRCGALPTTCARRRAASGPPAIPTQRASSRRWSWGILPGPGG
ncbi:MAG: metallophosphoesterase family protein [Actinobacteria bacterium]|nr:metallophosphoesterase family protein [Actinomycetota bacterium]